MKRQTKTSNNGFGRRVLSAALSIVMAASLMPALSAAQVNAEETELLKAGSIPASEDTLTYDQPLASGTGGSTNFRIPAFISVDNGEYRGNLVAAADARYSVTVDGGGLDTMASVSEDMGLTWHYSFPIYFPDSNGYDGSNATTAIDPALVEGADGTIYCLADMNPTGITTYFGQVNQGTGYVEIDGTDRLVLTSDYSNADTLPTEDDVTTYEYYVGDFDEEGFAPVLNRSDDSASGYGVDEWYNLYHVVNGEYVADLTQTQTNSTTTIQQNAFYKGSELHVYNTGYIWMVKSTDGGWTWEDPTILNPQIKRTPGENALLVSPGKGLTLKNGTITIPFYDHGSDDNTENVSFIYSKDNGQTWKRTNDVSGVWTSESEMVELEDGTLRMFSRNGTGKIVYADATMDENGDYSMGSAVQTDVSVTSSCNVTASAYSQKINGKQAILVACPTGGSRANGKIFTFLVNDDNTMELYATYEMQDEGYGTGYAYSCMDEQTDGSIGLFYEPNGSPQRCIYTSLDINDITGEVITVDLSDNDTYTETYVQAAAEGNITQEPDSSVATAAVSHETLSGSYLYSYSSAVSSSLESFESAPDTTLSVSDCEFTITSTGTEDIYNVQSVKTGKYWNTNQQTSYFGDSATDLKIVSTTSNGNTTFRVCLSGGTRYVVFYPTNMIFDAYNAYSSTATNVDFELVFLEKKESESDGDIVPGYQRASSITSGGTYLIGYIYGDGFIVLYPENTVSKHTKLIKNETMDLTTLTITKGTTAGITTAVVDGKTYKILADAEEVNLYKDQSFNVSIEDGEAYTADEGLGVEQNESDTDLLYDHEGTDGFSDTANANLSLSAAEMEFTSVTGSENTFTVKAPNGWYLSNAAAGGAFWSSSAQNVSFNAVEGETGAYEIVTGSRYLCFYFTENNFNANSSNTTFNGSYSMLVLEKKDTAAADDVISGYQKASVITSGKSYLIAYQAEDGSVYVLYPVAQSSGTGVKNSQTKKYEHQSGLQITVTGTNSGSYNLTVADQYYVVNVKCMHKNVKIEGAQEATCEAAGLTGTMTCTDCNEVIAESTAVSAKGHWYFDGIVTKEPTATEEGVLTYYCGIDPSHTKTESIPKLEGDAVELLEKMAEAEAELQKTDVYTEDSLAQLQDAYDAADDVKYSADESLLSEALADLQAALDGLVTRTLQEKIDNLNEIISTDLGDTSVYTEDSVKALETAINEANALIESGTATEDDLQAAYDKVQLALNGLVEKTGSDTDGGTTTPDTTETPDATTPDTTETTDTATDAANTSGTTTTTPGTTAATAETIVAGGTYSVGNYSYKVTSTSAKTVQVTGFAKESLTKIVIYNSVKLNGETYKVTAIAANAFKGETKPTSLTVKKGVTSIGANAFSGCTNLKKAVIKSTTLKSIGKKAFYNCKKLTSITIKSKSLKKVGKQAFKGINAKCVIKVPKAKKVAYTKLLKGKGQKATVKIK